MSCASGEGDGVLESCTSGGESEVDAERDMVILSYVEGAHTCSSTADDVHSGPSSSWVELDH